MSFQIYITQSGLDHDTGPGHPESVERLKTLMALFDRPEYVKIPKINASAAKLDWVRRAHPLEYIHGLQDSIPEDGYAFIDGDTVLSPLSYDAALEGAGAICQAVEDVCSNKIQFAFCASRPPGHHAEPSKAMGFCFFNNAIIGALHAQKTFDINRVAIIDFDVHHGNGSDTMARQHEGLFYASTHQWPLFPGTGNPNDNIQNQICNVAMPAHSGSKEFRTSYEDIIFPQLKAFDPDLIIISAGFDAHKDDPLGGLNLTEQDFEWITKELIKISQDHCDGKIISVLEGGYNLNALQNSVAAHIQCFIKS